MADSSFNTVQLKVWMQRMQAGDEAARDELIRAVARRTEHLARMMLRRFQRVRHWVQTDDVLQNALVRLLNALREVQPTSTRAFVGLAAQMVHRELLDLARHYYGPLGHGRHTRPPDAGDMPADVAANGDDPDDLARWCAFHEEVARLPDDEREVVHLLYYHGCTQLEAAGIMEVNVRTVQRRWHTAARKLHDLLKLEA